MGLCWFQVALGWVFGHSHGPSNESLRPQGGCSLTALRGLGAYRCSPAPPLWPSSLLGLSTSWQHPSVSNGLWQVQEQCKSLLGNVVPNVSVRPGQESAGAVPAICSWFRLCWWHFKTVFRERRLEFQLVVSTSAARGRCVQSGTLACSRPRSQWPTSVHFSAWELVHSVTV